MLLLHVFSYPDPFCERKKKKLKKSLEILIVKVNVLKLGISH